MPETAFEEAMGDDGNEGSGRSAPLPPGGAADPTAAPEDAAESLLLSRIVAATARATGDDFVAALPRALATTLGVRHALVAELMQPEATHVRTRALWSDGRALAERSWPLAGAPCAPALAGAPAHHSEGARARFPEVPLFAELAVEGFLAVPLVGVDGAVLGLLALLDGRPLPASPARTRLLEMLAARTVGELERIRIEQRLRESEEQFRDLFEEAPIAYVYEETSTRFVSANRSFMDLLGLAPEEVTSTYGLSLVAPARDVQERVHESLAAEQSGQERGAIEIELRRKDNGEPVWVQRWSRPEPDGKHTRTMIIDITARVLAERERARLQQQNRYLQEEIKNEYNFEEIVGGSAKIRAVFHQIEQVASTDATVLLLGETGTGKELIARALHSVSQRKARPLIKVNCAALPTGLIESELFGHEKGAFTGATEKRVGRFTLAEKGTLFLDEIGELAADVQVKLLRVLQERAFEPLGSARTQQVDVRVIAATNRDLARMVHEGTFRADLYYRLNVFPMTIPRLAERRGDIPLLVHYFVAKYAARIGRRITAVAPDTMRRLEEYAWPGNIRELENVIERAIILTPGSTLEIDADVFRAPGGAEGDDTAQPATDDAPSRSLADAQRRHIVEVLRATNWVIDGENGAARRLGLQPSTLRGRLKKLGIRREP